MNNVFMHIINNVTINEHWAISECITPSSEIMENVDSNIMNKNEVIQIQMYSLILEHLRAIREQCI